MQPAQFAVHLYQPFRLHLDFLLMTMWLSLERVQVQSAQDPHAFFLVFQGPPQPVLPAQSYRVEHPCLGALNLALAPLEHGPTGRRYKALVL